TPDFVGAVDASTFGAKMPRASWDFIGSLKIRVPPIEVQSSIADYLDRETARIDALIAEKERMLALLEEKRAALISRVVTCGLDPNVPLKPSGQEWLGEIPAHWPTTKFSWDVFISEGQVDPEDDRFLEMILIAPNHIESRTGHVICTETSVEQGAISGNYLFRKGDVLYSKIRPALRKLALADEDCLCSANMYALRPSERLLPKYLQYLLLSEDFSTWAELESARVAMPKINRKALGAIRIPVPPLQEQERIVTEIRNGTERIDRQRKAIRMSVDLLKERRAPLITAAVTGQITVKEQCL
ncbi:restriction endonuclease subunit S, partial [Benzoatithermus flavus]